MTTFLLILQALIGAILVGVILMQQSEGGGLGMGGSPSGLMSARGAADFLTRATTILASLFVALSIIQAVRATRTASPTIDTSLARPVSAAPAPGAARSAGPLGAAAAGANTGANTGSSVTIPIGNASPVAQPQVTQPEVTPAPIPVPVPTTPRAATPRERTAPSESRRSQRAPRASTETPPAATPPAATTAPAPPAPAPAAATTNTTVPIGGGTGGNSN